MYVKVCHFVRYCYYYYYFMRLKALSVCVLRLGDSIFILESSTQRLLFVLLGCWRPKATP